MKFTQEEVASEAGVTSRWIREIESGSPKPTLDDHLRCAAALNLSVGYLMVPMLFMERRASFPRELLLGDLGHLEQLCMTAISGHVLGNIRKALSPKTNLEES